MREPRANKTSPLVCELRRWQPRTKRGAFSVQWTAFAESLQERYGRTAIRQSALALLLAKPVALLTRLERWQHTVWQFYPKVNLAIGPILLRFESGEMPSTLVLHRLATLMRTVPMSNRESIAVHRLRWREPSVKGRNLDAGSGRDHSGNTPPPEFGGSLMQTPLMKVFARAGAAELGDGSSSRYGTTLVQRSLLLVSRITNERRRIEASSRREFFTQEQRERRELFTQEQRELSVVVNRTVRQAAVVESPPGMQAGAAGAMLSGAASSPDIESLTDQVVRSLDSRLVAHRERLGKVF